MATKPEYWNIGAIDAQELLEDESPVLPPIPQAKKQQTQSKQKIWRDQVAGRATVLDPSLTTTIIHSTAKTLDREDRHGLSADIKSFLKSNRRPVYPASALTPVAARVLHRGHIRSKSAEPTLPGQTLTKLLHDDISVQNASWRAVFSPYPGKAPVQEIIPKRQDHSTGLLIPANTPSSQRASGRRSSSSMGAYQSLGNFSSIESADEQEMRALKSKVEDMISKKR
jgi:hypothetical protein